MVPTRGGRYGGRGVELSARRISISRRNGEPRIRFDFTHAYAATGGAGRAARRAAKTDSQAGLADRQGLLRHNGGRDIVNPRVMQSTLLVSGAPLTKRQALQATAQREINSSASQYERLETGGVETPIAQLQL